VCQHGTLVAQLRSSATAPQPHLSPSIPPPPPLPKQRGETVGIRWGDGESQRAILAQFRVSEPAKPRVCKGPEREFSILRKVPVKDWAGRPAGTERRRPSAPGDVDACLRCLHVLDDVVPELGALDFRGPGHLAGEIVGHPLRANRTVQTFKDQVGRFVPAQVTEHHLAA